MKKETILIANESVDFITKGMPYKVVEQESKMVYVIDDENLTELYNLSSFSTRLELSISQQELLKLLVSTKIKVGEKGFNSKSLYSLYTRRLITCNRYSNGEEWKLTELGVNIESKLKCAHDFVFISSVGDANCYKCGEWQSLD